MSKGVAAHLPRAESTERNPARGETPPTHLRSCGEHDQPPHTSRLKQAYLRSSGDHVMFSTVVRYMPGAPPLAQRTRGQLALAALYLRLPPRTRRALLAQEPRRQLVRLTSRLRGEHPVSAGPFGELRLSSADAESTGPVCPRRPRHLRSHEVHPSATGRVPPTPCAPTHAPADGHLRSRGQHLVVAVSAPRTASSPPLARRAPRYGHPRPCDVNCHKLRVRLSSALRRTRARHAVDRAGARLTSARAALGIGLLCSGRKQ